MGSERRNLQRMSNITEEKRTRFSLPSAEGNDGRN